MLTALLLLATSAFAAPVHVDVTVESFGRRTPSPIAGNLWLSKTKTNATGYRAVLIVPTPGHAAELASLAEAYDAAGFNVLVIEPRREQKQPQRTLVEDLQSGVVFLRTEARTMAAKVLIVGVGEGANAAATYAAANRQMVNILDGIVLYNPQNELRKMKLADALKQLEVRALLVSPNAASLQKLCPRACTVATGAPGARPAQALKARPVLEYLLRPNG